MINGVVAVPVMVIMMSMARDTKIMGSFWSEVRSLCRLGWHGRHGAGIFGHVLDGPGLNRSEQFCSDATRAVRLE